VERPDGSVLVVPVVPTETGREVCLYMVWRLHIAEEHAIGISYDTDETLSNPVFQVTVRTYPEPLRVECRTTTCERRESGEALRGVMERVLASMGSRARCFQDAEPPGGQPGGGLRSVVSEEILDASVASPAALWRQTKEYIRAQAHEVLPDASVVQRLRSRWYLWDGSASFTRHVFDDAALEVRSYSHGPDASMSTQSLRRVSHLKLHRNPFRLEMFTVIPKTDLAGEPERAFLADLLAPVLGGRGREREQRQEEPEADYQMLAGLSQELKSSHQEVRGLLAALHTDMAALKEAPLPVPTTSS